MACRVNRSIHSGGIWPVGSGSAPLWMGVMWYTFFVSHPVKASRNSTRSWMKRPSMSWRNPSPAVGSLSICEVVFFFGVIVERERRGQQGDRRYRGAALASSRWVVSEASLAKDVERGS